MDPLSAVASIIAITQAVAAIGDGIKTLRSLAQASAEFCDMLNELSSPQALLDHLRSAMDDAVKSKSSLPSEALDRIAKFQVELSQIVNEIHVMANDLVRKSTGLNKVGEQKISGVRWQFRRGRITQLRDKARRCRDSISTCFDILGFSQMLHQGRMVINVHSLVETSTRRLNSQLDSFIAISQDQHRLVQSISESNKRVEDKAESLTAATGHLQQTADQVTNLVNRFDAIEEKLSTAISRTVTTAYSHPQAHHGSHFIQIQASVQQRCSRYCQCQCHRTVDFQTPRWARSIIGSIAMQYNSIPIFDPRRCNVPTCHSAKKGSLRVAYQFPKWLLNRALSITAIWGSLTNQGAALYLRLPRVINDNLINLAVTFTALERDRGLRISHVERLVEYKILPTDIVEESGETIFNHLISLGYAPTMVSLLEKSSIIGFNVQELYLSSYTLESVAHYHPLSFPDNLPQNLQLLFHVASTNVPDGVATSTIIIDAIRGKSNLSLENALHIQPGLRDSPDSLGLAPLHWAAMLNDVGTARILLDHGATVDIRTKGSRSTPLHLAISSGDKKHRDTLIQLLIGHGADVDAKDHRMWTPLMLAYENLSHIRVLLKAGANVYEQDLMGMAVLHWVSACNGNRDGMCQFIIRELVNAGADINKQDRWGQTPLFNILIISRDLRHTAFHTLLDLGADVNILSYLGTSIIDIVSDFGYAAHYSHLRSLQIQGLNPDGLNIEGGNENLCMDIFMWRLSNEREELTYLDIFEFCALIFEVRSRNWNLRLFRKEHDELMANGEHTRLRKWLGWQWQRLYDEPWLVNRIWECEDNDCASHDCNWGCYDYSLQASHCQYWYGHSNEWDSCSSWYGHVGNMEDAVEVDYDTMILFGVGSEPSWGGEEDGNSDDTLMQAAEDMDNDSDVGEFFDALED